MVLRLISPRHFGNKGKLNRRIIKNNNNDICTLFWNKAFVYMSLIEVVCDVWSSIYGVRTTMITILVVSEELAVLVCASISGQKQGKIKKTLWHLKD